MTWFSHGGYRVELWDDDVTLRYPFLIIQINSQIPGSYKKERDYAIFI